jgi:hypothetical protein
MDDEKQPSPDRLTELREQSKQSRELVQRLYEEARRNTPAPTPAGATRSPNSTTRAPR